jgi:hypothetical protein
MGSGTARYDASAGPIGVRVFEGSDLIGDYIFTVQARARGEARWREILSFRRDDPLEIGTNALTVVNDQLAFVVLDGKYLVTTDGGHHWSLWDAKRDLPDWICLYFAPIEEVHLGQDGRGTMRMRLLQPISCGRDFLTTDFGRTWTRPK